MTRSIEDLARREEQLARELDEASKLIGKLDGLLRGTANALKGEPPPLEMHSHHDLAEVAGRLRAERDRLRARLAALADGWEHSPHEYGPEAWDVLGACARDVREALEGE